MFYILLTFYVLIAILLIGIILIQQRTRGGLSSLLGGGTSIETIFGSSGIAPFITKATAVLAALFTLLAILLINTSGRIKREVPFEIQQKELRRQLQAPIQEMPQQPIPQQPTPFEEGE